MELQRSEILMMHKEINIVTVTTTTFLLTRFFPMFPFDSPGKHQKVKG